MDELKKGNQRHLAAVIMVMILAAAGTFFAFFFQKNGGSEQLSSYQNPIATSGPAFVAQVKKESVATSTIDITGCNPSPKVARIEPGDEVTFVNTDKSVYEVVFDPATFFVVSSSTSLTRKFEWSKPGVYKYSCGVIKDAGIIYVDAPELPAPEKK